MLRVGQVVDGYSITGVLNHGGQATVFRATDREGQQVAIKVLDRMSTDDWKSVRNFVDEALLSVGLRHPNIVQVYGLGEFEQNYYLVMECLEGCSLAQLLRAMAAQNRGLRESIALYILRELGRGLHAAHELVDEDGALLNVIHRDISPQNIFLTSTGVVKLIDFGIAKARGRAARTATGMIKGKLRYLAPEQARTLELDRRTDLYALGVVFWEMLTMRAYVDGASKREIAEQVINPTPIPPSKHIEVSDAAEQLVLQALQPAPADRPADVEIWLKAVVTSATSDQVAALVQRFATTTESSDGSATTLDAATLVERRPTWKEISEEELPYDAVVRPIGTRGTPTRHTVPMRHAKSKSPIHPLWIIGLAFALGVCVALLYVSTR